MRAREVKHSAAPGDGLPVALMTLLGGRGGTLQDAAKIRLVALVGGCYRT